jgi:hypothetical protein
MEIDVWHAFKRQSYDDSWVANQRNWATVLCVKHVVIDEETAANKILRNTLAIVRHSLK